MTGLTPAVLSRACRIFLRLAYPDGEQAIPGPKRVFWAIGPDQLLEAILLPPLCQPVATAKEDYHGYALRLGSAAFPHLKLQVLENEAGRCVFSVDTHDA